MAFFFDPSKAPDLNRVKEGKNPGRIVSVEEKATKDYSGRYIEIGVAFGATNRPEDKPMVIKKRFNIVNASQMAVDIGLAELAKVYAAAKLGPADVTQLRLRWVECELKKEPGNDGKMYFEIVDWFPLPDRNQAQQAQRQQPHPQQQQAQQQPPHQQQQQQWHPQQGYGNASYQQQQPQQQWQPQRQGNQDDVPF